jgi:hypothetical protein
MTNNLRDVSVANGLSLAKQIFEKRGNHSEVHLGRDELAAICATAFEIGYKHPVIQETD